MRHGHAGSPAPARAARSATVGQVLDARADIEALAAAILLAQQRLADGDGVERRDEGAHGQAIDRRRGDQAHVAHAGQRQLQGARDRRRGQRQHMDVGAQLLQPLLVGDAEMLLLVDDQQAEILELDALGQQRMRADDDVDRAVLRALPWSPWPPWPSPGATGGRSGPAGPRSARRRCGDAGAPAASSGRSPPPACPTWRRRRRRAAPPRSCRSRHRRRSAGPSACPTTGPRARRRWPAAGRRSRHRGSGRRTRRRGPPAALIVSPRRIARSAAIWISWSAMSAMRCLSRALRDCQATPPSRSSDGALLRRAVAAQHVDVLDRHEQLVAAVVDQPQAVVRRAWISSVTSPS